LKKLTVGYKLDKFELISSTKIDYDVGHRYEGDPLMNRGQLALVLKLKHKETGKIVNAIGTHIYFHPRYSHIKYLQVSQILAYIEKNFTEDDIVVFGGDFNMVPNDNIFAYIKNKSKPTKSRIYFNTSTVLRYQTEVYEENEKTLTKSFDWGNSYESYGAAIGKNTITFPKFSVYHQLFQINVDYILYNKKTLAARKLLKLPSKCVKTFGKLPNCRHPSDHLPIMTVFDIL